MGKLLLNAKLFYGLPSNQQEFLNDSSFLKSQDKREANSGEVEILMSNWCV